MLGCATSQGNLILGRAVRFQIVPPAIQLLASPAFLLSLAACGAADDRPARGGPPPEPPSLLQQRVSRLDECLAETLTENARILLDAREPQPVFEAVTDEDFVRRAHLDAIGRLPDATETLRFLDDATPDKHARLVDALLASPEWSRQRFNRMASLFRLADEVLGASQRPYLAWFREAVEKQMPWDALALALLTASGDLKSNPAAGWLLRDHGWLTVTMSETLRIFLSADLHCATCHDDPFADWTQMQFYQASACFGATRISRGPSPESSRNPTAAPMTESWPSTDHLELRSKALAGGESLVISDLPVPGLLLPRRYLYRDGHPGDLVLPRVLRFNGEPVPDPLPASNRLHLPGEPAIRERFARWLVAHPRFAQTIALRVWDAIFPAPILSRKMICQEPAPDGMTMAEAMASNGCAATPAEPFDAVASIFFNEKLPAAHSRMVRTLGVLMEETGFDVREFQRIVMHSEAYRIAAAAPPSPRAPMVLFSPAPGVRRLTPEALWDTLLAFIGPGSPGWLPSDRMPSTLPDGHPLRILGRGNREWSGEEQASVSFGLARFMHASPMVRKAVAPGSALHTRCDNAPTGEGKINLAFLSTLNRRPTPQELASALDALATDPSDGLSNTLWALLNTTEFLFVR
jgi:hypothetical protein